jgi:hypothetical protein
MDKLGKFNGNISELSAVMQRSWAANTQEPLLYTESFLQSALHQPGMSADLTPAIYDNGVLVAFGAVFPRQIAVAGRSWKIPVSGFLTVALDYQKWGGLGVLVWRGLTEAAKAQGCDGMISYCVEGDGMDPIMPRIAKVTRLPTQKVFTVRYLARPVPKNRGPFTKADPDILLRCAKRLSEGLEFARVWTEAEAAWQCNGRDGAFGAAIQNGDTEGTISASTMLTGGAKPIRCGLVDDILWNDLEQPDKKRLVDQLLDSASATGVELMLVPVMNYADITPFQEAGFRKTRRVLNMYLTVWNPELPLREFAAPYIDVF